MDTVNRPKGIPARRVGLAIAGTALGLALALTVVIAAGAGDLSPSYKTGPLFAHEDDIVTFTIVASNIGSLETDVVLSETVPSGATFSSCTYITQTGSAQTCGPLSQLWQEDMDTGDVITTTFVVLATAETMQWPLVNCARLSWDSSAQDLCFTTTVNPWELHLPIVSRTYAAAPRPSFSSSHLGPLRQH